MSSEGWKKVKIESSPIDIIDGDRGSNYPKQDEFYDSEHCLFLNTSNVTTQGFNFEKTMFITHEKDNLLRKGKLQKFDIILTTRGTVGNVAFFDESVPYENIRINSGMVIFRNSNPQEIETKYFYQFLRSSIFREQVLSHSSGSAQPQLPIKDLKQIELPLPPLPTQRRIADILSALDEKIELNRQTNATLETIAQAIFKEWFVDFNFPGTTGEMVEGALGLIPHRWRVGKLGDFGNMVCGKTPLKANASFFGGEIPFIKIPDMHNTVFITETEDSLTDKGASSQKNKFLPPYSIIVSCIATVGLVALTSQKSQTNQQINAIVPKNEYTSLYLYFYAKGLKGVLKDLGSGGSATLNVNTTSFSNIGCIIPPEDILSKFYILVKPLFEEILSNTQEISALAKIRDTLLPKLMSGEIEV